ncbi:CPBP family intramembrane glutamic endopeptidase [Streptomyces sp. NPDC059688]|uniref:CPBP family intramembrane glutamic endopeptidase n=1 Tax=Streptomyces sp. NPDC059688 TaxID=3346906 RepID=UPI0036C6ACF7
MLFFAGCVIFRPLVESLGMPHSLGFTLAGLLLATPFELGFLIWRGSAGRRISFGEAAAESAGFRRRLPVGRLLLIVASLVAFTAFAMAALSPVTGFLQARLFADVPDWMLSSDDSLTTFGAGTVIIALILNVIGDCVLSPIAEELYYRGHLLARIPANAVTAAFSGAALFAATHFWEPELAIFVFLVQALLGLVVQRTQSIRVSIYVHITVNTISTAISVISLL